MMARRGRILATVGLLALLAGFGLGVVKLLTLRYEVGDVYPAYSSLRADPLGTRALCESLQEIDEFDVQRNYRPHVKQTPATVLFLGLDRQAVSQADPKDIDELEQMARSGSRVVLAFAPDDATGSRGMVLHGPTTQGSESDLGLAIGYQSLPAGAVAVPTVNGTTRPATASATTQTGGALSWHNGVCFGNLSNAWRVLYACDGRAVVVERRYGDGSIVLVGDSYLFSNEAMLRERRTDFLAAMLGPNTTVVFDEYHLGVADDPGVVSLANKYHLYWAMASLLLLAVLLVWKNSTRIAPVVEETTAAAAGTVAGKAAAQGLVTLLRRSIPAAQLLTICWDQWSKSPPPVRGDSQLFAEKKLPRLRQLVKDYDEFEDQHRDVIGTYRQIARILNEKAN